MAVVAAGLWMSGTGRTKISPEVSHFLHRFWGTLGHIANTLIFFLVGLVIATGIDKATPRDLLMIGGAYAGVMAIRFGLTFAAQPLATATSDGVSSKDSTVISWGGLRGAVSLALALLVSQRRELDPELRRQILTVTAGVVLLTILVNGTTIGRLLDRLGYSKPPLGEQLARSAARARVLARVREEVNTLSQSRQLRAVPWDDVRERLRQRCAEQDESLSQVRQALDGAPPEARSADTWLRALALERQAFWDAYAHGLLGAPAIRLLGRELERQADRIGRGNLEPPETRVPRSASATAPWWQRLFGGTFGFERLALLYDLSRAEVLGAERVLSGLGSLGVADSAVLEHIAGTYQRYLLRGKERIEDVRTNLPEVAQAIETRLARRIELNLEREGYEELAHHGVLEESVLDAELAEVETQMKLLGRAPERVPIPETADLVAQTPLFSGLDAAALTDLAELTEEIVVPRGEHLFREGEQGDSMYVVARGAVHVLRRVDDDEVVVDVLGRGDILGEMALLSGEPRTASCRAASSVTLGKLDRVAFDRLMGEHPALRQGVWREFARRTFDNHVASLPRFARLDHQQRLSWFGRGESVQVGAGASLTVPNAYPFLFLVTGAVRRGDATVHAPALRFLGEGRTLSATEATHALLLPDPLEHSREALGDEVVASRG
jgi:hypothetical protein